MIKSEIYMNAIDLIKQERERQISVEGYNELHDDEETNGEMACAASVYACPKIYRKDVMNLWKWDIEYYKPDKTWSLDGRIKELTKAGALICAEIDRLNRLKKTTK